MHDRQWRRERMFARALGFTIGLWIALVMTHALGWWR